MVHRLVVDGDDAVFGQEGVGDIDFAAAAVHELADRPSHGGLAVAGRTVNEHRAAADDGGADGVEQVFSNDQVAEAAAQHFRRALDAGDRLAINLFDVVFERHGGGADIGTQLHGVLGAAAAEVGKVKAIADAADQVAAGHFQALFVLEEAEGFFDDLERQAQVTGHFQAEHAAERV